MHLILRPRVISSSKNRSTSRSTREDEMPHARPPSICRGRKGQGGPVILALSRRARVRDFTHLIERRQGGNACTEVSSGQKHLSQQQSCTAASNAGSADALRRQFLETSISVRRRSPSTSLATGDARRHLPLRTSEDDTLLPFVSQEIALSNSDWALCVLPAFSDISMERAVALNL